MKKATIYSCPDHDHCVCIINGEEVFSNDYCLENVLRLLDHLNYEVEKIILDRNKFEANFA